MEAKIIYDASAADLPAAFRIQVVQEDPRGYYTIRRASGRYISGPHPGKQYAIRQARRIDYRENTPTNS